MTTSLLQTLMHEKLNEAPRSALQLGAQDMARQILIILAAVLSSCDPEGRTQCSWVIEAEPRLGGPTDEGLLPVCARNRTTMKQDCRLAIRRELVEKVSSAMFRYSELKLGPARFPREILEATPCQEKPSS